MAAFHMAPLALAVTADPFLKSPNNPINMSRTAENKITGHAPSVRVLERARESASDLAQLASTQSGWKFVTEKNNTMIYEMHGRALPPTLHTVASFGAGGGQPSDYYIVRGVTTVNSNVHTMLELLTTSTTDGFKDLMRQIFPKNFINGITINNLTCTTPPPFAVDPNSTSGRRQSFSEDDAYSVNWLSLRGSTSLSGSETARDFTFVCYQDAFQRQDRALTRVGKGAARESSAQGTKLIGVHAITSLNFANIPHLPKSQHTSRVHLRNSGFVIEETNDPNTFRLSMFLSLLPSKSTLKHPKRYQKWLQSLCASVGNLARMTPQPLGSTVMFGGVVWKDSDHCFICLKMFRTFRRCHHCRFCGEAVCGNCSGFVNAATRPRRNSNSSVDSMHSSDSSDETRTVMEIRGCTICLENMGQYHNSFQYHHQQQLTASGSRHSSSSSNSITSSFYNSNSSNALPQAAQQQQQQHQGHAPSADSIVDDEDVISFGDESDRHSATSHHSGLARKDSFPMTMDSLSTQPLKNLNDYQNAPNTLSLSTASSSFSRTSHEERHRFISSASSSDLNLPVRNYSASEVSFGGDLSTDPDILALAGLTMKPRMPTTAEGEVDQEDDYRGNSWSGAASMRSSGGGASVRSSGGAASYRSSGGTDAGLRLQQQQQQVEQPPPKQQQLPPQQPSQQTQGGTGNGARFHFSVMKPGPSDATKAAVIAAVAPSASACLNYQEDLSSSRVANGKPPMMRPQQQQQYQPQHLMPSMVLSTKSTKLMNSRAHSQSNPVRMIPQPHLTQHWNPSTSMTSSTSSNEMSDMILLNPVVPAASEFVEFQDATRESIFVRPDNGSDMIPLDLMGKF